MLTNKMKVLIVYICIVLGLVTAQDNADSWDCPSKFPLKQRINYFEQGPIEVTALIEGNPLDALAGSGVRVRHNGTLKFTFTSKQEFWTVEADMIVSWRKIRKVEFKFTSENENSSIWIGSAMRHIMMPLNNIATSAEIILWQISASKPIKIKNLQLKICLPQDPMFEYPAYEGDVCPSHTSMKQKLDFQNQGLYSLNTNPEMIPKDVLELLQGSNVVVHLTGKTEIIISATDEFIPIKVSLAVTNISNVQVTYKQHGTSRIHNIKIEDQDWTTINSAFREKVQSILISVYPWDSLQMKLKDLFVLGCFDNLTPSGLIPSTTVNIVTDEETTPDIATDSTVEETTPATATTVSSVEETTPDIATASTISSVEDTDPANGQFTTVASSSDNVQGTPDNPTTAPTTQSGVSLNAGAVAKAHVTATFDPLLTSNITITRNIDIVATNGDAYNLVDPKLKECICKNLEDLFKLYKIRFDIMNELFHAGIHVNSTKIVQQSNGDYDFVSSTYEIFCIKGMGNSAIIVQSIIDRFSPWTLVAGIEASTIQGQEVDFSPDGTFVKPLFEKYSQDYFDKLMISFKELENCLRKINQDD